MKLLFALLALPAATLAAPAELAARQNPPYDASPSTAHRIPLLHSRSKPG